MLMFCYSYLKALLRWHIDLMYNVYHLLSQTINFQMRNESNIFSYIAIRSISQCHLFPIRISFMQHVDQASLFTAFLFFVLSVILDNNIVNVKFAEIIKYYR